MKLLYPLATALVTGGLAVAQGPIAETQDGWAWRKHTHALTGQVGVGWYGLGANVSVSFDNAGVVGGETFRGDLAGSPAATLAYDYRAGRSFSVGGAVGVQTNRITNVTRDPVVGEAERLSGDARVNRTFLSARTLWHYGRAKNVEFYSGLRLGLTVYRTVATGEVADASVGFLNGRGDGDFLLPHLTVIPFGFKGYLGEHVYLGAETMFGSPHFAAAQVGYRF